MIVTTKEFLLTAQKGGQDCAFNVENMEMAQNVGTNTQTVIETANRYKSPVILQTTQSTLK